MTRMPTPMHLAFSASRLSPFHMQTNQPPLPFTFSLHACKLDLKNCVKQSVSLCMVSPTIITLNVGLTRVREKRDERPINICLVHGAIS